MPDRQAALVREIHVPAQPIEVALGERGGYSRGYFGLARAADHAWESYPFEVSVDVLGNGARPREFDRPDAFVQLEDAPVVEVIADQPARDIKLSLGHEKRSFGVGK